MNYLLVLLLLSLLSAVTSGLHCYEDKNGIKRSDDEEDKVEVERFKKVNCSSFSAGGVEKVKYVCVNVSFD